MGDRKLRLDEKRIMRSRMNWMLKIGRGQKKGQRLDHHAGQKEQKGQGYQLTIPPHSEETQETFQDLPREKGEGVKPFSKSEKTQSTAGREKDMQIGFR